MTEHDKYKGCCILLSGGTGSRMSANPRTPKQYMTVAGRSVIEHTLYAARNWKSMDSLIIVADKRWHEYIRTHAERIIPKERAEFIGFADPGQNRQMSVVNALHMAEPHMDRAAVVMIHDAVRPLLPAELIGKCDAALCGNDGVMPYLPVKDTVYVSKDGAYVSGSLDRDTLYAGQTPEFFRFWRYLEANDMYSEDELLKVRGSSEPAVSYGMRIALVEGDERNFKLTTAEDMERFRRLMERS